MNTSLSLTFLAKHLPLAGLIWSREAKLAMSNHSADQVRKKGLPFYFAVGTWTSNFILHFYNALNVSSPKMDGRGKYILYTGEDQRSNRSAER